MSLLVRHQFVPAAPARVWAFFSAPANLNEITPPDLRFEIVGEPPARMEEGQLIEYRISPVPGIWTRWLTEIRHVEEGRRFVDEQRLGPYKFWYHEHRFEPRDGGVLMTDRVSYEIGWGPLGWLAEKLWVRRQLEHIFDFRTRRVAELFESGTGLAARDPRSD
jgi:ligand-binding SRPBCC domain-containing protein